MMMDYMSERDRTAQNPDRIEMKELGQETIAVYGYRHPSTGKWRLELTYKLIQEDPETGERKTTWERLYPNGDTGYNYDWELREMYDFQLRK